MTTAIALPPKAPIERGIGGSGSASNPESYDDVPGINWSRLKAMRTSPRHFATQERFDPNAPARHAIRIGLAVHCLVLEPDLFGARFAHFDGGARRGKIWTEFKDDHAGMIWLNDAEHDRAKTCATTVVEQPHVRALLTGGANELTLTWTDADTGLACKGRTDVVTDRLVDLKTAAMVEDHNFSAACARLGYHCQLAFYSDGLAANGYTLNHTPAMVVIESGPPYDVVVYDVPADIVDLGRREYRRLLARLVECQESDNWPGVANGKRQTLQLPEWAYREPDEELSLTMGGAPLSF